MEGRECPECGEKTSTNPCDKCGHDSLKDSNTGTLEVEGDELEDMVERSKCEDDGEIYEKTAVKTYKEVMVNGEIYTFRVVPVGEK